nr:hypothetical protein Iba_chr11dCG5910 [Ipomoea batatas]GMD58604.1 hypothetical protein Iba_chr11fCG7140 [Ipomoea batatas]
MQSGHGETSEIKVDSDDPSCQASAQEAASRIELGKTNSKGFLELRRGLGENQINTQVDLNPTASGGRKVGWNGTATPHGGWTPESLIP